MNVHTFQMNKDELAEAIYLWAQDKNKIPYGDFNKCEVDYELDSKDSISVHLLMTKE